MNLAAPAASAMTRKAVLAGGYGYLIIYVILTVAFTAYLTSKLNPSGTGRAILVGIGATLLFIFFGFRWFSVITLKNKNWPPTLNMCPDYLTFVPNITGSNSANRGGCVDLLGVTKTSSGLKTLTQSDIPNISPTDRTTLFEFTSDDIAAARGDNARIQSICTRCRNAGLTWEGVYDGDTCLLLNRAAMTQAQGAQCQQ